MTRKGRKKKNEFGASRRRFRETPSVAADPEKERGATNEPLTNNFSRGAKKGQERKRKKGAEPLNATTPPMNRGLDGKGGGKRERRHHGTMFSLVSRARLKREKKTGKGKKKKKSGARG